VLSALTHSLRPHLAAMTNSKKTQNSLPYILPDISKKEQFRIMGFGIEVLEISCLTHFQHEGSLV
jgi:hypothetical protein